MADIEGLKQTILNHQKSMAVHKETVHVKEEFKGQTAWEGDVEVFELVGHPTATKCYAWVDGDSKRHIVVLHVPPVDSARRAVQAQIAAGFKFKFNERP